MFTLEVAISGFQEKHGKKQVLFGINFEAPKRKITAIIGPNGSGKSTALKAIFGLIPVWNGNVIYNGGPITNRGTRANVKDGIGFVPQGNRVFDEMTVLENLEIGGLHLPKDRFKEELKKTWELFPELEKRKKQNSGGYKGRYVAPVNSTLTLKASSLMMPNSRLKSFSKS